MTSRTATPVRDRRDDADSGSFIKQGFLCPECEAQFQNTDELEGHFNSIHLNEKSPKEAGQNHLGNHLNNLNKFFGKAKKILKTDARNEDASSVNDSDRSVSEEKPALAKPKHNESDCYYALRQGQTIGFFRDHFDEQFKKIRNSKIERDVQETNKLLIRIDQLLQDIPAEPEKRRAHEMSVVVWANDEDVRLCIFCAKSFNISRRRHHCRLCGAILCNDCSLYLDLTYAKQLINPVDLDASSSNNVLTVKDSSQSPALIVTTNKNNAKRASTPSLLEVTKQIGLNLASNITNKDPAEYQIKTCRECKALLDRRMQQITDQHTRPLLRTYYEKLKNLQLESDKLAPLFVTMCLSLRAGESIYQLEDAQLLRIKLMKLGDQMDALSKQIMALNFEDGNDYQSLRNKLRLFVAQYLQRNLLGLPSLPYEYELKELQERRCNEIRLALESGQAREDERSAKKSNRSPPPPPPGQSSRDQIVSTENGWNIEKIELNDQDDDPILLQINIIKQYIERARSDHKYDEVNLLESNLKQLEIEYFLQENEKQIPNSADS